MSKLLQQSREKEKDMEFLILVVFIVILLLLASCVKIVPQANAYVVERLGAYQDRKSVV